MNTRDDSKWDLLQRNALKKTDFSPSMSHHSAEILYTHGFMFPARCHVWCSSLGCSGLFCFLSGTSGLDWPLTLSFPCLCTVQWVFPLSVDLIWTPCQSLCTLFIGSPHRAGPGCFEEWPFSKGWPGELAGSGPGNWFLTQSSPVLLLTSCSTLNLSSESFVTYPT